MDTILMHHSCGSKNWENTVDWSNYFKCRDTENGRVDIGEWLPFAAVSLRIKWELLRHDIF